MFIAQKLVNIAASDCFCCFIALLFIGPKNETSPPGNGGVWTEEVESLFLVAEQFGRWLFDVIYCFFLNVLQATGDIINHTSGDS